MDTCKVSKEFGVVFSIVCFSVCVYVFPFPSLMWNVHQVEMYTAAWWWLTGSMCLFLYPLEHSGRNTPYYVDMIWSDKKSSSWACVLTLILLDVCVCVGGGGAHLCAVELSPGCGSVSWLPTLSNCANYFLRNLTAFLTVCCVWILPQYVHYEVESVTSNNELALMKKEATLAKQASEASHGDSSIRMFPPQVRQPGTLKPHQLCEEQRLSFRPCSSAQVQQCEQFSYKS